MLTMRAPMLPWVQKYLPACLSGCWGWWLAPGTLSMSSSRGARASDAHPISSQVGTRCYHVDVELAARPNQDRGRLLESIHAGNGVMVCVRGWQLSCRRPARPHANALHTSERGAPRRGNEMTRGGPCLPNMVLRILPTLEECPSSVSPAVGRIGGSEKRVPSVGIALQYPTVLTDTCLPACGRAGLGLRESAGI